jgi:hypothetical protein
MLVDIARGKAQLHLCHGAHFAPHRQPRSDQGGTFWHAAQSVVSLEPLVGEHLRIDPLAIVAHAQSELLVIVAELDLDNGGRAHGARHSGVSPRPGGPAAGATRSGIAATDRVGRLRDCVDCPIGEWLRKVRAKCAY